MVSDEERAYRVRQEELWQRVAGALATVREMREVIVTAILMDGDEGGLFEDLKAIGSLEGRLLREARKVDEFRFVQAMQLNHRQSWKEVLSQLQFEGNLLLAEEIHSFMPVVCRLLDGKFEQNIEDV